MTDLEISTIVSLYASPGSDTWDRLAAWVGDFAACVADAEALLNATDYIGTRGLNAATARKVLGGRS